MTLSELEHLVSERAGQRCEFCRMHQSLQGATFHLEHVLPKSRGGITTLENLAWACPSCNLHKASRVTLIVPGTAEVVPLFNPRINLWPEHFRWNRYEIEPLSSIATALIAAFDLNHERRQRIRKAEEGFGLFP